MYQNALNFYSHTPRGVRLNSCCHSNLQLDFYSHTPRGVRRIDDYLNDFADNFYSHTPRGVRLSQLLQFRPESVHFYSHTPRGVRLHLLLPLSLLNNISTHTPLAGCDDLGFVGFVNEKDFYSHTPRGVRHTCLGFFDMFFLFLLTHPSRGATMLLC